MSCSLWMVAVQQEAMVHSKDFTALLDMFVKKQQIFGNTLEEKQLFQTRSDQYSEFYLKTHFILLPKE